MEIRKSFCTSITQANVSDPVTCDDDIMYSNPRTQVSDHPSLQIGPSVWLCSHVNLLHNSMSLLGPRLCK